MLIGSGAPVEIEAMAAAVPVESCEEDSAALTSADVEEVFLGAGVAMSDDADSDADGGRTVVAFDC